MIHHDSPVSHILYTLVILLHTIVYSLYTLVQVAPIVKARMVAEGTMMMNYQPLQDLPNFLRMTLTAPRATKEDMDFVLDEVERLGRDIDV